ncbi:MAG: GntR family transcriptional regulator [Verrucomicrobia bacterium]|nr:GntR family transcriptional regulator [Verrucomicrobiota bacterium]
MKPDRRPFCCARGRPEKFPLVKQRLRNDILQGKLKAEEQLPSFHNVARNLGVGSLTAKRAIDELVREGWLVSRQGVGTFVRVRTTPSSVVLRAPWVSILSAPFSAETLEAFHESHPNIRIMRTTEPDTDLLVGDTYGLVVGCLRGKFWRSIDGLKRALGRPPWDLPRIARRTAEWQGDLYALPLQLDLTLFQFNPALLRSFGIPPPKRYLDWEQYERILVRCRADIDKDGVDECFGSWCHLRLKEWLVPFWQRGGRLDDREAFFSRKSLAALDDLWRLIHCQGVLPLEFPIGQGEMYLKQLRNRFNAGKAALRCLGIWEFFRQSPFPTDFLLPRFGPVQRQHVEGLVIGVHRDCKYPELALEFLDFCYQRYVKGNPEYPFGLTASERGFLQQRPEVHGLLQEGLETGLDPLHEGVPERTWAIEYDLIEWFRLFQDRATTMRKLREHWYRWPQSSPRRVSAERPASLPDVQAAFPMSWLHHDNGKPSES